MVTQEQRNRYSFQQTKEGKEILAMKEYMKREYCSKLKIPISKIKTGKMIPLVDGNTGELVRFIEE